MWSVVISDVRTQDRLSADPKHGMGMSGKASHAAKIPDLVGVCVNVSVP